MNKTKFCTKRIISLILSLILTLSCFSVISFAAEIEEAYPTIYLKGQGSYLTNADGKIIYPLDATNPKTGEKNIVIPEGYVGDKAKELVSPLSKGLLIGNWKDYNDTIYNAAIPYLEPYALDENGNVANGSKCMWTNSASSALIRPNSTFKVWYFEYDWRLDPVECAVTPDGSSDNITYKAKYLHDYIEYVKAKTGSEKVNILARCLGINIFLAYAAEYGTSDIDKCLICCSGFEGFETIGAFFSGDINFDSAALKRFADCYLLTETNEDDPTFEMLRELVSALQGTPLLGYTSETINSIFKNVKNDAWKRLVKESYGTFPSFWSFIGDDYYEKAKTFVFGGEEEKYAGLIAKIDNYHYNILNKYDEILDKAEADGTKFYNVVKYGLQLMPITGADMTMSDTMVSTSTSSLGATCSKVTTTLSSKYLASADAKYISPDKQIDASTCKYPDHTWFIKNMSHRNMPDSINSLFEAILSAPGYATVDEVEGYPQFIMASDNGNTLVPATASNSNTTTDKMNEHSLSSFLSLIFKLVVMLFEKLLSK